MTATTGICPVCGAHSLPLSTQTSSLLAVCDILVIRALEAVGKIIVRRERSRFDIFETHFGGKPWHLAHTLWQADDKMTDKVLDHAWDVVPSMLDEHGCCGITSTQVVDLLDKYCRDLLLTKTGHSTEELRYRFEAFLGLELAPPKTVCP